MYKKLIQAFYCLAFFIGLTGCVTDTPNSLKAQIPDLVEAQKLQQSASQSQATADEKLKKLAATSNVSCNAKPNPKKNQYIIGYGSLMQDESRKRSTPKAGTAYPVGVNGFQRGWFAKGGNIGFDTIYLGAIQDKASKFNAVIYKISANEIAEIDKREYFYCRQAVDPTSYTLLKQGTPKPRGQTWIYVTKPESIAAPNAKYPIVQSYVDIFISGCLEQEQRFALKNFAKACLVTTTNWSNAWVNDRIYPRRPFLYQPKANEIDKLLKAQLPDYFQQIRIELSN